MTTHRKDRPGEKRRCMICGGANDTVGAYCPGCKAAPKHKGAVRRTAVERAARPRRLHVVGHMAPTRGDRDETCALYADCLTAHVVGHRGRGEQEVPASCPPGCRWRVPGGVGPATAYASPHGEARG